MVLCYHKEAFISGMLLALVLFSVIILFENVIEDIIKKLNQKIFKVS